VFEPEQQEEAVETTEAAPAAQETQVQAQEERLPPTTLEEMVRAEVERLRSRAGKHLSEYQNFLSEFDKAQPSTGTEQQEAPVDFSNLPEDITVSDLANLIIQEAVRRVRQEVSAVIPKAPVAEMMVSKLVKKYPYLRSVSEEGVRLLEKLPPTALSEEVADWVLHAIKGRKAEAERAEAVLSLFDESSPHPAGAPYTERDLSGIAEEMGIDPTKLRKRLLEKGGGRVG